MSAVVASAGTVTLSRSLPFTWTGISRVDSTTAAASTTGHVSVWIEDQAAPAAARRRLHSSSVMCGAAGASIKSSTRIASSQSGDPATDVPRYRNSVFDSSISFAIMVLNRNAS